MSPQHRQIVTRDRVAALLAEGCSLLEIARRLGLSRSTVSYHARNLGRLRDEKAARRYDWSAVQRYYDAGNSVTACQAQFGFARESWNQAVRRGDVVPRTHPMPLDRLLVSGRRRSRMNLKLRLVAAGLKEEQCERCGTREWLGRPLSMALHHVNGDGLDNRLENLQFLCPNCHSQTENFSGRKNRGRATGPPSVNRFAR